MQVFFGGTGSAHLRRKIFLPSPKMRNLGGGQRGLTVSWKQMSAKYYHVLTLYILPIILPFYA